MFSLRVFAVFCLIVVCSALTTVPTLNVDQYLGRWYQIYANAFVFNTFEKDAVCVTADYHRAFDGKIGILNSNNLKTPSGPKSIIRGYAYVEDASKPGQLTVQLNGIPFDSPYWIVQLGPVVRGKYSYSVITDPLLTTLFVLARNVNDFYSKYNSTVYPFLLELGFTSANSPIVTLQSGCNYSFTSAQQYATQAFPINFNKK